MISESQLKEMTKNGSNFITVQESSDGTMHTITGPPEILARIMFWIGDVVWPNWFFYETSDGKRSGKKAYLEYAENCVGGDISCGDSGFFDVAWPKVKRHLEVDGVTIITLPRKENPKS